MCDCKYVVVPQLVHNARIFEYISMSMLSKLRGLGLLIVSISLDDLLINDILISLPCQPRDLSVIFIQ